MLVYVCKISKKPFNIAPLFTGFLFKSKVFSLNTLHIAVKIPIKV